MQFTDVSTRIRKAGFRATRPRIAFLNALARAAQPLGITEIGGMLRNEKIDPVTLYRIAESFEKSGLIARVDLRQGKTLYEFSGRMHHHHIVCTDCGTVEDVEVCLPETMTKSLTVKSRSFTSITSHALEFFGTCTNCS